MAGRAARNAAGLALAACGDPSDVQVPLPLRPTRAPSEQAQAVLQLRIDGDPPESAGASRHITLPESAPATLIDGDGERLINGRASHVECSVLAPLGQEPFTALLRIEHASLPAFQLRGVVPLPETSPEMSLSLELQLPEVGALQAQCTALVHQILPGAAWLTSIACDSTTADGAPAVFRVQGAALFEHCQSGTER